MEVLIFIAWLALCGAAAYIAANKGRSGVGVFFLSFFLSPLVGIIVAFALSPNVERVAIAQGKKKCPNCAEFVQPDARTCRFCQHSFVEEEAAERARLEEAQAAEAAHQKAEYEAQQAAEAAEATKPWLQRNAANLGVALLSIAVFAVIGLGIRYAPAHPYQPPSASESKPAMPTAIAEERGKVPKSVWDKRVAWAIQHHCYFRAMSRDEVVGALSIPTEEASYDLTYKRQTKDCARYEGDNCAEYKTEEKIIFLKDGYLDEKLGPNDDECHTLYGEHEWLGLQVPHFDLSKARTQKTQRTAKGSTLAEYSGDSQNAIPIGNWDGKSRVNLLDTECPREAPTGYHCNGSVAIPDPR